jgi:hypothetical protein
MRAAFALLALLAGCASGTRPYVDDGAEKNLAIRTASTARASLDVHGVDAQCRTHYLGTVALDRSALEIHVPPGRASYLEFGFATSGFFSPRTHSSRGVLLHPRAGARYQAEVTYRDDIYNVVIRERGREVALQDLSACRPAR